MPSTQSSHMELLSLGLGCLEGRGLHAPKDTLLRAVQARPAFLPQGTTKDPPNSHTQIYTQ